MFYRVKDPNPPGSGKGYEDHNGAFWGQHSQTGMMLYFIAVYFYCIGEATAEKMMEFRLVVWGMHGIYGAGKTMDETFGLIETVEKAAQIYMLTAHLPRVNTIRDDQMKELAEYFGVNYRKDFLNL